ncbi:shikimate dehydrogenase [bacterium]|nr:shikimate dehydrogenase [bacterium]
MPTPFLLGGRPFRWLNHGVKPEVFTPASLPSPTPGRLRYGVLGFPVAHSLSPSMQEAGFRALGIQAEYLRVEIPGQELAGAIPALRQAGFQGWNCTLPHKEAMFALCDAVDATAKESTSANTVVASKNGLRGYSTDADGWEDAVAERWKLNLATQRILILGCGGVGRTLAIRLAQKGCRGLILANRSPEKAARLRKEILPTAKSIISVIDWNQENFKKTTLETDLVIQATSLGLSPTDPLPLPEGCLRTGLRIFDTVYRKDFTPLIRLARSRGADAVDGLGMLLHQGVRALAIWTGRAAPVSAMRQALEKEAGRPL